MSSSPHVAVVVATVVAMVLPACSEEGSPSASPPGDSATSSSAGASVTAPPEAFSEVPDTGGAPEPLAPGTISSPEGFEPALTFDVPDGWYGGGDAVAFSVGQGLNEVEQRYGGGGIMVEVLQMPMNEATQRFAELKGIDAGKPTTTVIDGRSATVFSAHPTDGAVALEALGSGADVNEFSDEQFFVDVGADQTLLIRTEISEPEAQDAIASVLGSLRFVE